MENKNLDQQLFDLWRAGNAQAQGKVYAILKGKFFYVAVQILRNYHDAEEAFYFALFKLDAQVQAGKVQWRGEGRLCSFARTAVWRAAMDRYRELNGNAYKYEREHRVYWQCDDESGSEYLDRIAAEDWLEAWMEEQKRVKSAQKRREVIKRFLQEKGTERDRRFWKARMAWTNIPGSDWWSDHQISAFLKEQLTDLNLSDSAYYTAKSRFESKLKPLWEEFF